MKEILDKFYELNYKLRDKKYKELAEDIFRNI